MTPRNSLVFFFFQSVLLVELYPFELAENYEFSILSTSLLMAVLFSACLFPKEMIESDISSMMSGIIRNSGQNHHPSPQEYR